MLTYYAPSLLRYLPTHTEATPSSTMRGVHLVSRGDPLAMAMYATLPLIRQLQGDVSQSWYADDAAADGGL